MRSIKRTSLIVANWKMYKTIEEAIRFVTELIPLVEASVPAVYLAVPFTVLHEIAIRCKSTKIAIGAQNMNEHEEGAFTGEISGRMLKEAGAKFVIIGHSERRQLYHESNELVNKKLKKALEIGLKPILCVGETAAEREKGDTIKVLTTQLRHSLADLTSEALDNLTLAYEPIWAIGTNQTAMPETAQEIHHFCRRFLDHEWGTHAGQTTRILYGGSVKPENAGKLMEQKDIDGLLVGNASLSVESFEKIVNYSNQHLTI
jgi:triosephosphate isomerase